MAAVPRALIAVPTFRCALRCQHCELWSIRKQEISPELWRARLLELADEVEPPYLVGISGGEPLLYAGIHQLIRTCQELGWSTALATSTQPLDDARIRRLLASGLSALVVSLDGMGVPHDEIRRKPGLFEQVLRVIGLVKQYSPQLNLTVVATVTRKLVGQLVSMLQWVHGRADVDALCLHTLSANLGGPLELDPEWFRHSALWPGEMPQLDHELEQLEQMARQGFPLVNRPSEVRAMQRFYADPLRQLRPCDQHELGMIMLPDGGIKLCPLHDPVGNIRDHSLLQIWRGADARRLRRTMRDCRRNCHFLTNFAFQRHLIRDPQQS